MEIEVLNRCNVCDGKDILSVDVENNICKCQSCGYVFDSPRPTSMTITAFYSKPTQYDSWLSAEAPRDALWARRVSKLRKFIKPGTLLDVGAGIGQFLDHARPFFTKVSGTDVSTRAIEIAKEKYNLELTEGDLTYVDFGAETTFDNITMFHVLEHVSDPKKTVRKCYSLLSDGGVLVIAVPNDVQSVSRRLRATIKLWLRCVGIRKFKHPGEIGLPKIVLDGSMDEIHLSHFTPPVLCRLLEDVGFQVQNVSLDPYYVATGWKLFRYHCIYIVSKIIDFLIRKNIYATIWIVGKKVRSADSHDRKNDNAFAGIE